VKWETSQADVLNPAGGFMSNFDYTMQFMVGCPGGCSYCYVISGYRLTPWSVKGEQGRTWGYVVRQKARAIEKFKRHLDRGDLADKTIYWSGITDPYAAPPYLTQPLWQVLIEAAPELQPRRIAVQTRFRPDRDAELIARYEEIASPSDGGPAVVISYSIGTDRNDLIRAWEKATPTFEMRLRAIEKLREARLWVVPTLSPLGMWKDLSGTLKQFKAWEIPYITTLFFKPTTAASSTPRLFLNYLSEHYPNLLDPQWQADRVAEMQQVYGDLVLIGQDGFSSLTAPQKVETPRQTEGGEMYRDGC
jgi:DNA repair photolyase